MTIKGMKKGTSKKGAAAKARVVIETFESDESEEISEDESGAEVELGDDLEIKQEVEEDCSDNTDETPKLELEIKEVKEEEEEEEEEDGEEEESIEETKNTNKRKGKEEAKGDEDNDHFGDVETSDDDEADGPKRKKAKKLSSQKSISFAEDDSDSSESDGLEVSDDDFGLDESEDEDKDEEKDEGQSGLADVMAKILGTKKKKGEILSKAKKDYDIKEKKTKVQFEVVDEFGNVKKEQIADDEETDLKANPYIKSLMRKAWVDKFHAKPDVMQDREKERKLRIIATQGVVQLFGAIEKHKALITRKIQETNSICERETVLENTGKEAFLKVLKREGRSIQDVLDQEDDFKMEVKDEPPRWKVLSDNFYKEATLKGWDQQSQDDDDD